MAWHLCAQRHFDLGYLISQFVDFLDPDVFVEMGKQLCDRLRTFGWDQTKGKRSCLLGYILTFTRAHAQS